MCGYVWLCVAMCGCVWQCVAMFGYGLCVAVCERQPVLEEQSQVDRDAVQSDLLRRRDVLELRPLCAATRPSNEHKRHELALPKDASRLPVDCALLTARDERRETRYYEGAPPPTHPGRVSGFQESSSRASLARLSRVSRASLARFLAAGSGHLQQLDRECGAVLARERL